MKKNIIAIAIFLFIGVNTYSQNDFDLMKVKAQAFWCQKEVDGKICFEERVGLFYIKQKSLSNGQIKFVQQQLINIGYDVIHNGIIDEKTIVALTNHQEYISKKNIRKRKRDRKKGKK